MLHIYVDGSASRNGKNNSTGGFGIIFFDENFNLIDAYCEYFNNITNNQMELKAILKTFELLNTKYKNTKAIIYSDSSYCINTLTSWIYSWNENNWKNKKGVQIKNLDIITSLYQYYKIDFFINQIDFVKVSGHKGIIGNELADALAQKNVKKFSKIIIENNIKLKI